MDKGEEDHFPSYNYFRDVGPVRQLVNKAGIVRGTLECKTPRRGYSSLASSFYVSVYQSPTFKSIWKDVIYADGIARATLQRTAPLFRPGMLTGYPLFFPNFSESLHPIREYAS